MRFLDDFRYSMRSLSASKGRTFLTMLGVIIGVMSVLAVSSIGLSAQELVVGQVATLGSNVVAIMPGGDDNENGPPLLAYGIVLATLDRGDERALGDLAHVDAVTSYARSSDSVSYGDESFTTSIIGVSDEVVIVEDFTTSEGRFFSDRDLANFARVTVLGYSVAEKLFPKENPIGKTVKIKNLAFKVVGVSEERGSVFFQNQDDQVFIPVTTAQRLVLGIDYVNFIRMRIDTEENVPAVKAEVDRLLTRRHRVDEEKKDFTIRSTDQAIEILGNVTGAMKAFLIAVTAVSLLVGGINIMNIMFVAVRERTKEIGLRKALGAQRNRILTQFLVESAFISLLGGIIGIAAGVGLAYLAAVVIIYLGYDWQFIISTGAIFVSLGVSVGVGIIFGMYPAIKAAQLDALTALRYE